MTSVAYVTLSVGLWDSFNDMAITMDYRLAEGIYLDIINGDWNGAFLTFVSEGDGSIISIRTDSILSMKLIEEAL